MNDIWKEMGKWLRINALSSNKENKRQKEETAEKEEKKLDERFECAINS